LDNEVKDFLKRVANTVLKLEIVTYYYEHPFAMDTAEGLGRWLNRRAEDLSADLDELVRAKVLTREGQGREAVHSYNPDEHTAALVKKVVSSYRLTRDTVYSEVFKLQQKQAELRREYQKLLFTERGRTETILNSLDEAVLVLDRSETVLLANGQFLKRFALPDAESHTALELEELVGEGEVLQAVRSCVGRMEEKGGSLDFFHKQHCYKVQSVPVSGPDGKVIVDDEGRALATVTVFRDVTQQREIERMRQDFISMLTHDLKNPLGIIFGSSTLVLEGKLGPVTQKQHKLLSNIVKSCVTMERLIEDFLTLSKLEAGQIDLCLEPVNINDLLERTLQLFYPQCREKKLKVSFRSDCADCWVVADSVQLERVVSNLISNAVKYNLEGGRIELYAGKHGKLVQVDVTDSGQGIPQEELPYVFEKFHRTATAQRTKGTGLGLAIARELIRAMGGEIWVESKEGQGSCFSFSLPLASV